MVEETILQHWIFTKFIFPFALVTTLVYAVLEKTKLLGEKHQLNAIIAFVIGLIFTGVVYPALVVQNMILFLSVALVILFVILLLWGFIFGDMKELFEKAKWIRFLLIGVAGVAVIIAVLWAVGVKAAFLSSLFQQSWSNTFWTNFLFILVIAIALALILKTKKESN